MDNDEFVLNLSGFSVGPDLHKPSRTEQRRKKWVAKREFKKQRTKGAPHLISRSGRGLQTENAPAARSQLKGYSLDAPKLAQQPARPTGFRQVHAIEVHRQVPSLKGFDNAAAEVPGPKRFRHDQGSGTRKSERPTQASGLQAHQQVANTITESRPTKGGALQEGRGRQQPLGSQNQLQVGQAHVEHASRRFNEQQARDAETSHAHVFTRPHKSGKEQQRQQQQKGQHRGSRATSTGGGRHSEAGESSKRLGRLRMRSKVAGGRESTPDQDDIRAPESDDEPGDLMAAISAAVERDKRIQQDLEQRHAARFAEDSDSDSKAHMTGPASASGRARAGGVARGNGRERGSVQAAGGNHFAAPLATANGQRYGDDEAEEDEDEERPCGVVEFGGDYATGTDMRSPPNTQNADKRRNRRGAAPAPKPRVSVRPGELVHGGSGASALGALDVPAAATATGELFSADVGSFHGLGLSQEISGHLASLGFAAPTRVQQQSIPPLLGGQDVLVHASTGSGKTLSYLAPIVDSLAVKAPRIQRADGTHALVITPTRELCLQVTDVLTLLVRRFVWVVGGGVHGGENRSKEKARLRKGVTVLVATPGRLLDHLQNTHAFKTDALGWLVLDEADRLLDMGFEKKIAEIVSILDQRCRAADYSHSRRTALLSATLHSNLGSLASLSLQSPTAIGFSYRMEGGNTVIVHEGTEGGGALQGGQHTQQEGAGAERYQIPKQLQQRFVEVPCKLRLVALAAALHARLLAAPAAAKVVVFFSNCDSVEFYHAVLTGAWEGATGSPLLPGAAPIFKLHGNLTQAERTEAFLGFTKCPTGVLLCTDVAARGLDFPAVTTILQFDPPGEAAEYVHRVGRTARLGQRGDALLCLLPSERPYLDHLRQHGVALQQQPLVSLLSKLPVLAADEEHGPPVKGAGRGGREGGIERHQGAYLLQKRLMDAVERDQWLQRLGEDAFRSYVRAYATHSTELKPIFHIKSLHLGHVAHSFALRERPSMVGQSSSKASLKKRKAEAAKAKGKREKRQRAEARVVATKGEAMAGYHLS